MADDPVLADLQRLMDAPPEAPASDPLMELEALVQNHQEQLNSIIQKYADKKAALETQIAASRGQNEQAAKEAEIAKIKEGLQPAA